MGIIERKERDKLEMHERIIEAATAMFLEDGYDKTSIRQIADTIEYSPATIYLYFKDKDELFFAIHEIGFQKLLKNLEKVRAIKNPLIRLRETGVVYIEFALKNPEYYDLMFIMRSPMNSLKDKHKDEQWWHLGEITFAFLQETVQACIDEKLIRAKEVKLTALYVWSFVHGLVSLQIRDRFQIMDLPDTTIKKMLLKSLDELVDLLKT